MDNLINTNYIVRNCKNKTPTEKVKTVINMIRNNLSFWDITNLTNVDHKEVQRIARGSKQ